MLPISPHRSRARQFSRNAARLGAAALAALLAGTARAHDFWIEPERFRPQPGESVPLRLYVGEHFKGEPVLYLPAQFKRYVAVGPDGEASIPGTPGDDPAGTVTPARAGIYTIGYHSEPYEVSFDSLEKFEAYLNTEGLERHRALAERRFKVRNTILETYTRHAKALLRVGGAAAGFDRVLGFPLELVVETDPYAGDTLTVRVLYDGEPLEGILVVASNKRDPMNKQRVRSDREGRATVLIDKSGVWLINAVHMVPGGLFAKADWRSYWASLTFERP